MEEQQRNIDEFFRKSLYDYREAPPGIVWQDIASRLDVEDGRRKRAFLRWPWIALSLLLIVGSGWIVVGLNTEKDSHSAPYSAATVDNTAKQSIDQPAIPLSHISVDNVQAYKEIPQTDLQKTSTHNRPLARRESPHNLDAVKQASATSSPSPSSVPQYSPVEQTRKEERLATLTIRRQPIQSILPVSPLHRDQTTPTKRIIANLPPVRRPDMEVLSAAKPARITVPTQQYESVIQQVIQWYKPATEQIASLPAMQTAREISTGQLNAPGVLSASTETPASPTLHSDPRGNTSELQALVPQARATGYPVSNDLSERQAEMAADVPKAATVSPDISSELQALAPQAKPIPYHIDNDLASKPAEVIVDIPNASVAAPDKTSDQPVEPNQLEMPRLRYKPTISLAVLGGYEKGFNDLVQNRVSAALRLMLQVSEHFGIGLQPAYRVGSLTTTSVSNDALYQRNTITIDSFHTVDVSPSIIGGVDTIHNYVVRESFDSITVKGRTVGGTFWEIELPVVLHYQISKAWHIYGGPSVNFGGKLSYNNGGDPNIVTTVHKDSLAQSQALPAIAFNHYFGKSSLESYSSYQPAPEQDPASVRFGYLIGASYEWKRLMVEASVHQQLSGNNDVSEQLHQVYTTPYVRVSVGYLLFSSKGKSPRL